VGASRGTQHDHGVADVGDVMSETCTHDFTEREIAVTADGYCPLCMAAEIERLQTELASLRDLVESMRLETLRR
jgi:hypothetical protein